MEFCGRAVVLMGVSGSGKSTIGDLLAKSMDCPFLDADDFHSQENKEKMKRGVPLTDSDRWPWLEVLRATLTDYVVHGRAVVLACSALKPSYRQILRSAVTEEMNDMQPTADGKKEEMQSLEDVDLNSAYGNCQQAEDANKRNPKSHKLTFLLLQGPIELFGSRLHERFQEGTHFMPPSLLLSQLDSLKISKDEDDIFYLDASLSPAAIGHRANEIVGQHA